MTEVRGIIIDFFNERPYYYQAKSHAESRALHKVYELLKGCSNRAPKAAITSIAIATGCNNDDEYHIHHGKTGVLLEAMAGMAAALLSNTNEPKVIECLFVDAMHDALLEKLKNSEQKKEPSQMRGCRAKYLAAAATAASILTHGGLLDDEMPYHRQNSGSAQNLTGEPRRGACI